MVMLGCQAASAQSRLKNAVLHLDVLRVNLALSDQVTTLSTSGCKDAMIMSLLQALWAIISIDSNIGILLEFGQEIVHLDCEKGGKDGALVSPSLKVLEGPMEPFTRTLAVHFVNQEDSHSVRRRGTSIFDIIIRSLYAKHNRTPDYSGRK